MPTYTSGLGAQLGVLTETVWGTPVTVTKFFEFQNENVELNREFLLSQQLRGGRFFSRSTRRIATTGSAAGTVNMEVPSQGFGVWLNQLHGNTVTPAQQAGTTAYKQTHNIGTTDPLGKSLTVQIGRPSFDGTVRAFTYSGCVVPTFTLAASVGSFLTASIGLDGKDETTATALATASYPTGLHSFTFVQGTVTIDSVAAAAITDVSLTLNAPRKVDRFYLGSATKSQQVTNAYWGADLGITCDFADLTYYNKFASGNTLSTITLDFVGPVIASAYTEELKITLNAVGWGGNTPNAAGPDVLQQTPPLQVLDDGTNAPVIIDYTSTDTAL